jgi:protein-S-isoprenylcysteine O-methyltransferase Ste14
MKMREFIFRNRSYTPIPAALTMFYFTSFKFSFSLLGLAFILIGELIRITAVRYAGGATRTMNVGAPSLCMSGPYSFTRNPLYLGNMIIYLGFVLFSGGQFLLETLFFVFIFFTFQYSMIISLEEETLIEKFANSYSVYKKNVPRLFPRLNPWINDDDRTPNSVRKTIKTEKRSLQNIFIITIIIIIKNMYSHFLN